MSALYNAQSRQIDAQLDFYFTGTPVTIDKSNYLISFNLLEELGKDAEANPIGDVSANELDIKLFNDNGIFSPSNTESPYYGLMKAGVKVVVKMRASESSDWDDLGTFYVNDWYAEVTGLQASVTCYDKMHSVISSPLPVLPVTKNVLYRDAFAAFLKALGVQHDVDASIAGAMSWWYALSTSAETLKTLTNASMSAVFCDRHDTIKVLNTAVTKPVKETLTDGDQIISASITQSITRDYDGLDIVVNGAQLSDTVTLLDIKEHVINPGTSKSGSVAFTYRPVTRVECAALDVASTLVDMTGYTYNTDNIEFSFRNDSSAHLATAIRAYGRVIETVKTTYEKNGTNPLVFDNAYAQTEDVIKVVRNMLFRFVASQLPVLSLNIRGNPKLLLGDKITVQSTKYNLLFTGMLQRASYTYDGSLRCTINLVDSRILEVI